MDTSARARELALLGIEVRATQSENTGTGGGYQPPHVPAGSSKGGQFGSTAGTSTAQPGYKSILPPDSAYNSGSGKKKAAAPVPSGTPRQPAEPRTMKAGDSGEDVRYAQYAMNLLGFKVPQDGQYGPETEAAIKQIQERLGVKKPNGHLSSSLLHKMQDAVRLSPCVGAGQRDLAFEAAWEQRDVDESEDDEPDETAEAILDAIDEVLERSADSDWDERADVSKELRIPGGHEGGGRWTAGGITKAIAKALEDWSKGEGPDDPFTLPPDANAVRDAQVDNKVRAAYRAVHARNPDTKWVMLSDLRKELGNGASREEVDAALKRLAISRDSGSADVVPESNQKALTAADRAGAVHFGGQDKHAISFDDPSPQPVSTGKPIDREPLRKAAVARGITLKRGASREDIVKALLDDVRTGVAAKKAESPNLPGVGKDHRRFTIQLGGKVDPAAVHEVEVENKIRTAYRDLARNPRDHVTLADLRERTSGVDRAEFDATLKRLAGGQLSTVHLAPEEDRRRLTPRLREASVHFGGEDMHSVAFEDASPRPAPKPSGTATDVGIFGNPSTGKLSLYRESDTGKRTGRAIGSFDDMGALESWARDNGHTELADYAKAEQAKTAPKAAFDPSDIHAKLDAAQSRQEGLAILDGLTVAQLKQVYPGAPGRTKAEIADDIVHVHVGARLTTQAFAEGMGHSSIGSPRTPDPATILSSLPSDLTPAQKRARLRSRGVPKEQIDALVPLKAAKAAAPKGPRPSGLPHDRRPASGDFTDLSERIAGKPEAQILQVLQDLNATELAALARKFPGTAMLVPGFLKTSDRRQGLRIPDGLTLEQKREWLAKQLGTERFHWRSADLDDEDLIRSEEDDLDDDDTYDDEPSLLELEAMAAEDPEDEAERALGHDVTPGHDELHHYWTRGEGLAKWVGSPHQWTTLYHHLVKYVTPEQAKRMAAAWVHEVTGFWPGSDMHRVIEGSKPRGHRIGRG